MAVSILHTADLHLSSAAEEGVREDTMEALALICDTAQKKKADFLLICGDLFDCCPVDGGMVDFVRRALSSLSHTRVILIPGNHDGMEDYPLEHAAPHVFVLHREPLVFEDCNVRFHFGLPSVNIQNSPYIEIGLWHGDIDHGQYMPIKKEDIASSGLAYLALGHIHKGELPYLTGGTFMAYPGCPQGRGFDETGEKGVLFGYVDKKGVQMDFLPVARRLYHTLSLDVTGKNTDAVLSVAAALTNARDHYKITLTGAPEEPIRANVLSMLLPGRNVRFVDAMSADSTVWDRENEMSLTGFFIRSIKAQMEGADEEKTKLLHKALLLGLKAQSADVLFSEEEDAHAD